ncbi:MAG: bifunctional phosphopantothenoylcysteine decarboxylase/phosphopantothenate--cysteine ligase CoaBC [Pseudomonadota bacterium]|nr:bifunctional phosphopantothenoylcysteine decarboxylase/phosphopantothenate--cysteine ligase CoaBC [Pseudomonadota bacterium]
MFSSLILAGTLVGRRVLVGMSGGIAAYKSAELVRRLRQAGAEVRVVMTVGAQAFITPLTMQALSGHPVHSELLDSRVEAAMGHIELARWADAILIAPASANLISRLAHGLADDLLTTLCLASEAPLLLAPAMNRAMWAHPATQTNCDLLRQRGVTLLGPAAGEQACGEVGAGRMLEPDELVAALASYWQQGPLAGLTLLVTAGPTREPIDPVRYISNRSSGKMGYAVAEAALLAGAAVTLISGPTALLPPRGVALVAVESAAEMAAAVQAQLSGCDIFIAAAAVADYRPTVVVAEKIKKSSAELTLALERTEDILATVAGRSDAPFCVGFAAETHDLEHYARDKLARKGLDLIAANLVGQGLGFESDVNSLKLFWADAQGVLRGAGSGQCEISRAAKTVVARELIAIIAERYHAKNSS